ncbi:uncharacterized protein LOC127094288 [Lathyrus oleraceus]|uniref:uncharacterized protein LOC127094288 n=1 Tax=Pisum sativum TaxID=3888 RepID=UPI0021D1CFCA|nr:uncharacterized protein LOC127094288 [Pisum sativum]
MVNSDNEVNVIVPHFNDSEPIQITYDSRNTSVTPLVINLPGPVPYQFDKVVPYKYNATMIENGNDVPLPSIVNFVGVSRVTRSGRIFAKRTEDVAAGKQTHVEIPFEPVGQSDNMNPKSDDDDEVLKLIRKSEYNVVEQLLHIPSKIYVLSLWMNSEAHREALQKVLEQAYVDYDVTVGQSDGIIANITACNNLSFSNEELPEEGRNHNMALNISINCMNDLLSSVLVDTGSSLNVMPKSTLSRLSFQGAPMRSSRIIVKAFDGSRKTVIGEVNLLMTIGPHTFQIKFQVMDIEVAYSCLLGRPWIHEVGAVTSTLHQKLKFVKNGKLVTVCGEKTLVVSHLSSFSYLEPEEDVGTQFKALSLIDKDIKRGVSISSFKDAQRLVNDGITDGWGTILDLPENKHREGLGFSPTSKKIAEGSRSVRSIKETFHSGGFINPTFPEVSVVTEDNDSTWEPYCDDPEYDLEAEDAYVPFYFPHHKELKYIPGSEDEAAEANAIVEDNPKDVPTDFIAHGVIRQNWTYVDVPVVVQISKLIHDISIKTNDPMPSCNFEFPVYEAKEEEEETIPYEISRLLENEEKTIQPLKELMEVINLGSEEDRKEVKVGALLAPEVKERMMELLREYTDVFAWSYQDMPGLDTDIVEHRLPLRPECPPIKQKLIRTRSDMAIKIKEEVQKQIDASFLVTLKLLV